MTIGGPIEAFLRQVALDSVVPKARHIRVSLIGWMYVAAAPNIGCRQRAHVDQNYVFFLRTVCIHNILNLHDVAIVVRVGIAERYYLRDHDEGVGRCRDQIGNQRVKLSCRSCWIGVARHVVRPDVQKDDVGCRTERLAGWDIARDASDCNSVVTLVILGERLTRHSAWTVAQRTYERDVLVCRNDQLEERRAVAGVIARIVAMGDGVPERQDYAWTGLAGVVSG